MLRWRRRGVTAAAGLAGLLGALTWGSSPTFGQGSPATPNRGAIQVWLQPTTNGGRVLVTGALGDYGTTQKVNAAGKPSLTGQYSKLRLKKGTITLNIAQANAALNAEKLPINASNCSAAVTGGPFPVPIVGGTGAYAGISGSLTLTAQTAVVLPRTKSGVCNPNGIPLDFYVSITGPGDVSF